MATYPPGPFVEPLPYQPVEFLDIPSLSEATGAAPIFGERAGHVQFTATTELVAHTDGNTSSRMK